MLWDLIDFCRAVKHEAIENGFVSPEAIQEAMRENNVLIKDFWLIAKQKIAEGIDPTLLADLPYETASHVFFVSGKN